MREKKKNTSMSRREFNKLLTTAAISAPLLLMGTETLAQKPETEANLIRRNERSTMTYRKLGRTNFMCSRLVFGCGAALMAGSAPRLLKRAFEAGINYFDSGTDAYYGQSERNLAPFLKEHRDDIWLTSKAPAPLDLLAHESFTLQAAQSAAKNWMSLLERSLKDLAVDHIDAYLILGVDNPELVKSDEIYNTFLKAKADGKVGHFGLSSHRNSRAVLEAAIPTGWYDIVMIGITPAGWYNWNTKSLESGTPPLTRIQPVLRKARDTGIGLVGMKAVRYLAPWHSAGKGDPSAFDHIYDEKFKASSLNPFQRSYAYVLEHGLDVVNADMQNFKHLEENVIAATSSHSFFS